ERLQRRDDLLSIGKVEMPWPADDKRSVNSKIGHRVSSRKSPIGIMAVNNLISYRSPFNAPHQFALRQVAAGNGALQLQHYLRLQSWRCHAVQRKSNPPLFSEKNGLLVHGGPNGRIQLKLPPGHWIGKPDLSSSQPEASPVKSLVEQPPDLI